MGPKYVFFMRYKLRTMPKCGVKQSGEW